MKKDKKIVLGLSIIGLVLIVVAVILVLSTPKYYQLSYDTKKENKNINCTIESKVIYEIKHGKAVASQVESKMIFTDEQKTNEIYQKLETIFVNQNTDNIIYRMESSNTEIRVTEVIEDYTKLPDKLNSYFHELNNMSEYDNDLKINKILKKIKKNKISYKIEENPTTPIKRKSGSTVQP